jgi:hypothetical protein
MTPLQPDRSSGEAREAIMGTDGTRWVVGERLAYQGDTTCRNATCTRVDGRCVGWHCAVCGAPCSSQGHHNCPEGR